MSDLPDILNERFLTQHLNPHFLETVFGYWNTLKNAQVSDEEKLQIREALYNLVRFIFRHLFQPLYLKYFPHVKGTVFFLSAVHSDGIGDYIATLKCAQLLKEYHPEIDVHVAYTHRQKLPPLDPIFDHLTKDNIHSFHETSHPASLILGNVLDDKKVHPVEQELEKYHQEKQKILLEYESVKDHPAAASALKELADDLNKPIRELEYFLKKREDAERLYAMMKESLAIVHVALALNTFDNPTLASKSFYFAESGNFQGIANYLQRNWYSMGLQAFEEGIFLKKPKESNEWIDTNLTRLLWKADQPTPDVMNTYHKFHTLHLGYLSRLPEQLQVFIELICRRYVQDNRHIDIILPKLDDEWVNLNEEWMTAHGISKIISIEYSSNTGEKILKEIELPNEKKLRLIYALPIACSDFYKLMNISGEIIGCTGDGSLSDCLAMGKIPFYEVRKHKLSILESFRHLARILALPEILEYFEQLELFANWPAVSFVEKFEKILNDCSFRVQWKTLVGFITRYYTFEEAFLAHIHRHLFSILSWEIKEKEEMLIQDYFSGTISVENAYQTLEMMLKNRSSNQG